MKNYKDIFENIKPSQDLIEYTIQKATSDPKKNKSKVFKPTFAYICVILAFTIPVVANGVNKIYQLMNLVSPEVAVDFTPIEQSNIPNDTNFEKNKNNEPFVVTNTPIYVENNNIRLEVVAINIEKNIAKLYITLQDLAENRIDSTVNLTAYNIDGLQTATLGSEFLGFENGKATFMITITDLESQNILETITEQIKFSINEFTTSNKHWGIDEDFYIDVNISDIILPKYDTSEVSLIGSGGYYNEYTGKDVFSEPYFALNQNIEPIFINDCNFEIVACAYVDEKLHIQTKTKIDSNYNDSYSSIDLEKIGQDEPHYAIYTVSFTNFGRKNPAELDFIDTFLFKEYVFDINLDEIDDYKIISRGMTSGQLFTGNLSVSFDLK